MQHTSEADGSPFDPANHRLRELPTEVWEGFVFTSQSAAPAPLAPRIAGLTDEVARYRMSGYETVAGGTEVWHTNWKCLAENFLDAYHVFKVHRSTFAKESDSTGGTTVHPGGPGYTYHVAVDDPASAYGVAHLDNVVLEGTWRHSTVLAAVYPTLVVQLQPDWLWYLVLSPLGVGRVHIRWSLAVAPEVVASEMWSAGRDGDAHLTRILDLLAAVNAEDRPVIEGVWNALHHHDAARGPFSYLERNVFDIGRYIAACDRYRLRLNAPTSFRRILTRSLSVTSRCGSPWPGQARRRRGHRGARSKRWQRPNGVCPALGAARRQAATHTEHHG